MNKEEIRPENDVTRLSVPQVILLTLLVTTVCSIATAIVTVQLMSGIPGQTIFQTIEKVTETVIETPSSSEPNKTIVIKEGDLVAKAIAENSNSSLAIYFGDETSEILLLGHGFVVGDNVLISRSYENPDRLVTAGLHAISTHGSDKIMVWRTTNDSDVFQGSEPVDLVEGNPQVGQTIVYLSGEGSIVRGSVTGVSTTGLEFSESLSGRDIGLILEIGGEVIGLWTGDEIIRSGAVMTQIDQLAANPLYVIPADDFDPAAEPVETNPDDVTTDEKRSSCELMGGTLNDYDECLGVDQPGCLVLGGEWEECGSACRHDPDATVCTLQCELYCQL